VPTNVNGVIGAASLGEGWIEEVGEVELIGGFAEVRLGDEFAQLMDADRYHVFLTSCDPVLVFVQNRTARGFEIHSLAPTRIKRTFSTRCSYRAVARRKTAGGT